MAVFFWQPFENIEGSAKVFTRHGRVIEQNFIRRVYKRILKKAKLRYIKLHGFRHTFCAHLLSEDVSPYYVSQQAGHSSINITCDIYGSWIRSEENRHVNLLDSAHPSAPYLHPEGAGNNQPFEFIGINKNLSQRRCLTQGWFEKKPLEINLY